MFVVSFLICFEDDKSGIRIEFLIHGLELLNSHSLKPTRPALQYTDLKLHLAQLLLILLFLLLLILLFQHLQLILLLLQSLLNDLGSSNNSLLHFLHHICFYLYSCVHGNDLIIRVESSLLEEWF